MESAITQFTSFPIYQSMSFLRHVAAIIHKDITAELRTKEMLSSMFVFAVLSVVIFNFAFELRLADEAQRQS